MTQAPIEGEGMSGARSAVRMATVAWLLTAVYYFYQYSLRSAPGVMVPEFEQAMNALPVGGLSAPVVSRFGVHLIQVEERRNVVLDDKQLREQARNVLREQRFEQAYDEWTRELRTRAYVEFREPPQ